jgi:hypothetical protein
MGRELKRVALDFNWPLGEVWSGYINPHNTSIKCSACNGTGYSPYARALYDQWYGHTPFNPRSTDSKPFGPNHPRVLALARRNVEANWAVRLPNLVRLPNSQSFETEVETESRRLAYTCFDNHWSHHLSQEDVDALVAAGRLMDFTHDYIPKKGWVPKDPCPDVKAADVNEWSLCGFGHDSLNASVVIEARCERAGYSESCSVCKGEGCIWPSPEAEKIYEEWQDEEPPTGPGYQIWETVSEGSPISPVFETPEELARYMAANNQGIDKGTAYETWLAFIMGPGWAPSIVSDSKGIRSGVKFAAEET